MPVTVEAVADGATVEWLQKVRMGYEMDDWLGPVKAVLEGKEGAWKPEQLRKATSKQRRFHLEDGLLITESGRIVIPGIGGLREGLRSEHHDKPLDGHFGRERTLLALTRRFYWPGMARTVASYVRSCDVCSRVKVANWKPFGELQQLAVPDHRWSRIGIDFITKLPATK
jgi:hypothetical protein